MMNDTDEADDVAGLAAREISGRVRGRQAEVIHTDKVGRGHRKKTWTRRGQAARNVDDEESPINAIVSVVMLREGWDVQGVTVVVGLRPYTAKANILPEQTIGRGLRLMFRDQGSGYVERVDIIGNKKFLDFVDDLEKLKRIASRHVRGRQGQAARSSRSSRSKIGRSTTLVCRCCRRRWFARRVWRTRLPVLM